jgi:hypothetical protein
MPRVRFVNNLCGVGVDQRQGQVANVANAAQLIAGGQAIAEGPAPSGSIATLYKAAGYLQVYPNPSGYIGPSGYLIDVPFSAFYCVDDYTITVVFPGRQETTFDLVAMRPRF